MIGVDMEFNEALTVLESVEELDPNILQSLRDFEATNLEFRGSVEAAQMSHDALLAEKDGEILRLKTQNYDLLMAAGTEATEQPEPESVIDDDFESITIDDLFSKED